jgi:hypothetical protein
VENIEESRDEGKKREKGEKEKKSPCQSKGEDDGHFE